MDLAVYNYTPVRAIPPGQRDKVEVKVRPELMAENGLVYYIVTNYIPILISTEGVDATGIQLVLDIEDVAQSDRAIISLKIIKYVTTAKETSSAEYDRKQAKKQGDSFSWEA